MQLTSQDWEYFIAWLIVTGILLAISDVSKGGAIAGALAMLFAVLNITLLRQNLRMLQ